MTLVQRIAGAAAVALIGLGTPAARAAYTVTLAEEGGNVVAQGSGTIDLAGLRYYDIGGGHTGLEADIGTIVTGLTSRNVLFFNYTGFSGPATINPGLRTWSPPDSGSGDFVGIEGAYDLLPVPYGYVSGAALSATDIWDNTTFASLGLTPGTYTWTWGSGSMADSFTLQVRGGPSSGPIDPPAVLEPSSLALLVPGLVGLLALRRLRVG